MNLNDYLKKALEENWATGHFNASESDQFRAIAEAAKDLNTIAIIGTSEGEAKHLGYFEAVALRDAFRKELGIQVFLNSDHHKSVEAAKKTPGTIQFTSIYRPNLTKKMFREPKRLLNTRKISI